MKEMQAKMMLNAVAILVVWTVPKASKVVSAVLGGGNDVCEARIVAEMTSSRPGNANKVYQPSLCMALTMANLVKTLTSVVRTAIFSSS